MNTPDLFQQYVMPTYGRFPLVITRGEGSYLWDEQGTRYLDFCTGIAVCSLGHAHPKITQAICDQAKSLLHCSNLYQIPQQAKLAQTIVEQFVKIPGKVFFSNSGAEANDGLIKMARRYGHHRPQANNAPRFEILTFQQSFHGRTLGGIAATGQDKVKEQFEPLPSGFRHLPYNDCDALRAAIRPETVAILLEPIQGEGGVHAATKEFFATIAELREKHDLLILLDEVQVGFGRCGQHMAWRNTAPTLEPDAISWAKGLGGGVPIGAFWVNDRYVTDTQIPLSGIMSPGSHGSTYGGNPLVCAAAQAVLDEILEKNLAQHAAQQGAEICREILSWNSPVIQEVRGQGLLLGIALNPDLAPCDPGKTPALTLVSKLMSNGLLTPPAGPNTVRLLPPLNVSSQEIHEALTILRNSLT